MAPNRGCSSSDAPAKPRENGCRTFHGLGLRGQRDLLRHGPHTRTQVPGDGDDDEVSVFPAGAPLPLAFAQVDRGLPTASLDGLGHLRQAQWEMPTDFGRVARGPGACDQGSAGMGVAGLRDAALTPPLARGGFGGCEAQGTQELSGGLEAGEVPQCGYGGDRHGARHAPSGLERCDHWGETPGVHLVLACLLQTLETLGVCGNGSDVCLEDALRRQGGTDDLAEPPQVGRAPDGPTRLTDIVPQEKSFAPKLRGFAIVDSLFPCPPQVAHSFILPCGDIDGCQVPRAHQAGQFDGVSPVGCDPIPGFFGDHGGRDDPAHMTFFGAIPVEPIATRASCIDKDEGRAFGLQPTEELIDVTLSRPYIAEREDLGVVFFSDIGRRQSSLDGHPCRRRAC
jgi:hypothetical protein